MQALSNHVYIEEQYPGVTLGVIALPHGLIQIDAPPAPEDARSWRAALLNLNSGVERLLINLDGHPDRTLGARAMECTIIAHERTAETFRNRPNTFKAQGEETGSDWEAVVGLGSIRWAPPEISFTAHMAIEWSNFPVLLEHHSGPTAGAIWVILPEQKIMFVGDMVVAGQPPFFASANLSEWIKSLEHLIENYKDFTIISGRSGSVTIKNAETQCEIIKDLHAELEKMAQKGAGVENVEALIPTLLSDFNVHGERKKQYQQRLVHGLKHYFSRHYRIGATPDESEE
jgi:cyclase